MTENEKPAYGSRFKTMMSLKLVITLIGILFICYCLADIKNAMSFRSLINTEGEFWSKCSKSRGRQKMNDFLNEKTFFQRLNVDIHQSGATTVAYKLPRYSNFFGSEQITGEIIFKKNYLDACTARISSTYTYP